jgi:surfactin synthase thioesterase subunit
MLLKTNGGVTTQNELRVRKRSTLITTWFKSLNKNDHNQLQLFCFPYAGGGTTAFSGWSKYLPKEVSLHLLQLPGREMRVNEKPITNFAHAINQLADLIVEREPLPFVLFGHSFGGIFAFELAKQLYQRHNCIPRHMIIAGMCSPNLFAEKAHMAAEKRIEIVNVLQGQFKEALQEKRIRLSREEKSTPLSLESLQDDLLLAENYIASEQFSLLCPISAFYAEHDPLYDKRSVASWRARTQKEFKLMMSPGNHFSMIVNPMQLIKHINEVIKDYLTHMSVRGA